jgi:outer membrane immunogenic protein
MKSILITAASAAALLVAVPAMADSPNYTGITGYGNLGYSNVGVSGFGDPDFSAITGRVGARFGKFFGVEGELTGGFNSEHVNIGGVNGNARLNDQFAAYAVGYLPVSPNWDVLGRIGYGTTDFHTSVPGAGSFSGSNNSFNYGVGTQYMFDGANGVRADYTRSNYDHGPDGNTWALAYVRKF